MLDDLKFIHQRDKDDALGVAEKQWQQYQHSFELKAESLKLGQIQGICVAGMGGSAQAASALAAILDLPQVFMVARTYDLPAYVNEQFLLVISSYSGNTEETLSVLEQALARPEASRPMIVTMSSGGQIAKLAEQNSLPHIGLPKNLQPRFTFAYQCAALAQLLDKLGLSKGLTVQVQAGGELVKKATAGWRPDVPTKENLAKQIARELVGKSIVVYAGPKLWPVAYKWKINFNENAKNIAWCNQYSEWNHNELSGWIGQPRLKTYAVIELRSQYEHPRIGKRYEAAHKLLSGHWPEPIIVDIPKGTSVLEDMMWTLALGDFVSLYLALLNNLNPTPVDLQEKFKTELNK